ncbi:hypothetical protein ABBQ32_011171 [Trebouxia sp. C0010 RCD-2024]
MSAATPSWFRQQLYPPDGSKTAQPDAEPPGVPRPRHTYRLPADNLHNPGPKCQPWFSSAAPVQPTSQPASRQPLVADSPHYVTSPQPDMPSYQTSLSSLRYSAQAALHEPGPLLPVSQVMSRAPLPGPALQPSSPWKQTSPHTHYYTAPSTSGASVIIIPDTSQPTLAETLGFADSLQQSAGTGRPATAALPVGTPSSQLHHMSVNIRAAEILPQNTEAPSQAGQAQAEGKSRQAMQNGALSQPGLLKLVALVEATFASQHTKFDAFLHLLHEYQASQIDKRQFEYQAGKLFKDEPELHTLLQCLLHPEHVSQHDTAKQSRHIPHRSGVQHRGRSSKGRAQSEGKPKYMLVMRNLNKTQYRQLQGRFKRRGVRVNNWDHLMSWLSPACRGNHTPWWTFLFTAALLVIFFFMAGSYGMYLAEQGGSVTTTTNAFSYVAQYSHAAGELSAAAPSHAAWLAPAMGSSGPALSPEPGEIVLSAHATALSSSSSEEVREWGQTGPGSMTEWVAWQPSWRLFDFDFLLAWGGRYGPALHQGQWWRWITWVFVHTGFQHVLSNLLVWLALALPLECAYGSPRILAVWLISALGSAFFSAAFENSCTLVVGCSGAVFGFMGLYVADMALNFRSLSFPWLRLIWICATLGYFVVASVTQSAGQGSHVSYWAHLGGFICGLFPSFFFLPNLKDKRWQAASKLANRLGLFSRGSVRTQAQRKRRTSVIANSIRKAEKGRLQGRSKGNMKGTVTGMQGRVTGTKGRETGTKGRVSNMVSNMKGSPMGSSRGKLSSRVAAQTWAPVALMARQLAVLWVVVVACKRQAAVAGRERMDYQGLAAC